MTEGFTAEHGVMFMSLAIEARRGVDTVRAAVPAGHDVVTAVYGSSNQNIAQVRQGLAEQSERILTDPDELAVRWLRGGGDGT